MSTQVHDLFYHKDELFELTASSGELANIYSLLGYRPARMSTACGRGFIAGYEILDNTVALGYLETINVLSFGGGPGSKMDFFEPIPVNNVQPIITEEEFIKERDPNTPYRKVEYQDIALKLCFTGTIVIGDNKVWNRWGDFQLPWQYENVLELHFENGVFIKEIDLSTLVLHIREKDEKAMENEVIALNESLYADKMVKNREQVFGDWLHGVYR